MNSSIISIFSVFMFISLFLLMHADNIEEGTGIKQVTTKRAAILLGAGSLLFFGAML